MTTTIINKIKSILPIDIIHLGGQINPKIIINTPYKGKIEINLKDKHFPFLFGSVTETDKDYLDILDEIKEIENKSKDFLLTNWLKSLK